MRIAVNGQTGKAAALFYQYEKEERYLTLLPSHPSKMSSEHTVRTPPVPIKYVDAPFLYRITPLEEVLK